VILHEGRILASGPAARVIAEAGGDDIQSAFRRLTDAAAKPGNLRS
jgi:ABC-2 type transport system ATP-binding protein